MGVVVESSVWEPSVSLYVFLVICIYFSLTLSSRSSSSSFSSSSTSTNSSNNNNNGSYDNNTNKWPSPSPFDHSASSSFLRFQRKFILLYALASVMEGMWSVIGELDFTHFGTGKDAALASLCVGYSASLLIGTFLGILSDSIGHKKACLLFCILHLVVGVWRRLASHPSVWFASVCLSLATSIFSCSFESWLVVENEQQGYRQDALNETFWLMTSVESVALVGSQVLANLLFGNDMGQGMVPFSSVAVLVAVIGIVYLGRGWKQIPRVTETKDYGLSYIHLLRDKRLWLLGLAHTCLHFSIAIFWILWAPTLVVASMMLADGREVHLGLVYPCLLGARILGSTVFQWLLSGPSSPRIEDCLVGAFVVLGIVLSIVAYDYQEIGVLVSLFCLFHAGVGLILPSLARLRTIHVPSDLRGGMISLSLTPGNAVILFLLIQRGYYQNIENSTLLALVALALFVAAGCMHLLKRWGKQLYYSGHKL